MLDLSIRTSWIRVFERSFSLTFQICGHTSQSLREWAAVAVASLIKQAFKAKTDMTEAVSSTGLVFIRLNLFV